MATIAAALPCPTFPTAESAPSGSCASLRIPVDDTTASSPARGNVSWHSEQSYTHSKDAGEAWRRGNSTPEARAQGRGVEISVEITAEARRRTPFAVPTQTQTKVLPGDPMTRETKLLHLREPAALGDSIDGWRVFWLGGWDRGRLFFIVMVEKIVR